MILFKEYLISWANRGPSLHGNGANQADAGFVILMIFSDYSETFHQSYAFLTEDDKVK